MMMMRIFALVPLGGGLKWEWGCRQRPFLPIWVATSPETSEMRPAYYMAICDPLSACNWLQNKWPRMTLSGYFAPNSVLVPEVLDSGGSAFKDNCVKTNKHRPIPSATKCRSITLVSGNISRSHCRYSKAFLAGASSNRGGVVEIDVFAVFPLQYISLKNIVGINCTYDDTTFWIFASTNKDDLEWPWMPCTT